MRVFVASLKYSCKHFTKSLKPLPNIIKMKLTGAASFLTISAILGLTAYASPSPAAQAEPLSLNPFKITKAIEEVVKLFSALTDPNILKSIKNATTNNGIVDTSKLTDKERDLIKDLRQDVHDIAHMFGLAK
ncbi:hypothetical protein H4219_004361 [Mycoemilia scoparia]|uniref:Uncharacterized protein n=1 Tax=Mycoemilia scoparia TaxID=417184 RepID=A0A9W8DR94_9FUNG|nr:hypothetical protein H4219_004361 [Mycoemilia scoparia]